MDRQARELEDFFNVAKDRSARSTTGQPQKPQLNPQPLPPQQPRSADPAPRTGGWGTESQTQRRYDTPAGDTAEQQNLQAMILVKAMVNAAKCDGQISQAEQQGILSRLTNPSPDAIQFLREEFSKPLDVREFAWSVPVGMEQSVYSMSLIAVDVDSAAEEGYLRDLARGLRLSPEICAQIKERVTGGSFAWPRRPRGRPAVAAAGRDNSGRDKCTDLYLSRFAFRLWHLGAAAGLREKTHVAHVRPAPLARSVRPIAGG